MGSLMAGWDTHTPGHKEDMPSWLKEVRASGDGLVSPKARHSQSLLERQSSLDASSPRSPRARGSFKNDSAEGEATDPVLHAALVKCRSKVSGRPILGRTSAPTAIDTHRISVDSNDAHAASEEVFSPLAHVEKVAWWKHMDSGKLNEVRTDVPADYRMGSYMPQKQTARLHIHAPNEQTAS